ncbi:MAG: toll/interleukin-1 receptor domain-containing protein [Candidatus Aminicenantes bacterium]|jgi:hypothetical protein
MPRVFLSHNSKDKTIVKKVGDYLTRCLLKVWLDDSEMPGGANLSNEITKGIHGSNYFVPFISKNYFGSNWCFTELRKASNYAVENKIKILPVLLEPMEVLKPNDLPEDRRIIFTDLFKDLKYIEIDKYNQELGIKRIAESVWQSEPVRFKHIEEKTIDQVSLQIINFDIDKDLPTTLLQTWDFCIMDFLAQDEENRDNKPIKFNLPIAFFGRSPNWLTTAMVVPLFNKRTIFIYNSPANEYICAYSTSKDNMLGKVLKPK